ncbi:unnamed protein product [Anisakis simplex]|uniref:Protein RIC1 homolog n=1 Tax=Anisakis simplex TaxID=6269 RepID=A0A0M3K1L5_ANISI|nr:unnamed protein product [Anisakis simplex]
MFLPDRSETLIRLPSQSSSSDNGSEVIYCVVANKDRTIYASVTSSRIYFCLANPQLLLCTYARSSEDVNEKGEYRLLYWRYDSSSICVTTSKKCLLIYRIEMNSIGSSDKQYYNLIEPRDQSLQRSSQELFMKHKGTRILVSLSVVARLDSCAMCVVPMRDELFVCLRDGWIHRILWDGAVHHDLSLHLTQLPFAVDQLQSKPEFIHDRSVHVVDVAYAPLIGGFCVVLSNGKAALLTSPSPRFHPKQLLAVWALQMNDAVCLSVNHKFRLIIFGCQNGDIASYHLDDSNGSLTLAYRTSLLVKDGPEILNRVGSVSHIDCFTQGSAFAVVWSSVSSHQSGSTNIPNTTTTIPPILAIFSPFGAQLWCSLESSSDRTVRDVNTAYRWVEWGPEGFSLWLASDSTLSILSLARCISICNPNMENSESVVLLSSNRVLLSPAKEKEQSACAPHSVWNIFSIPNEYLSMNWPIRIATVDGENVKWIVAAGTRGFKEKLQERDMLVTGGLAIWRGFVMVACYDLDRDCEQLRFYPLDRQLDNQFCSRHETDSRVLMFSERDDKVITFDLDARIFIYSLHLKPPTRNQLCDQVLVERCAEIRVNDLVPHPACVVSIQITSLNHHTGILLYLILCFFDLLLSQLNFYHNSVTFPLRRAATFCESVDTVLINVSGRLIMLSPIKREVMNPSESDDEADDNFQLNQPMLIASYVEHIWYHLSERRSSDSHCKPHLTQALWICCGVKGMRVWMPLLLEGARRNSVVGGNSFINKRIMLPFHLDIYPIALGVESSPTFPGNSDSSTRPLYNLHRNSEVFLHHLLRQLLKRNLGVYALEIAATCTHLAYFGHVLELLLHSVLELEATSSEPIPDPLLPRVVAFIREFSLFLQTVAHCARKTELALWPALFAVTSHPKELFEMCIREEQLETAASFLIVLQNMESSAASREHASVLLEEALMKRQWLIARDIIRFLRAIHPSDIDYSTSPSFSSSVPNATTNISSSSSSSAAAAAATGLSSPRTSTSQSQKHSSSSHQNVGNANATSSTSRRSTVVSSSNDNDQADSFLYTYSPAGVINRTRLSSTSYSESVTVNNANTGASSSTSVVSRNESSPNAICSNTTSMHNRLDQILNRHAKHLLEDYSIRDLGAFAAYLDFDLLSWLCDVRNTKLIRIEDYGLALMRLHAQFKWPYPLVSQSVVDQLTKRIEMMRSSQSCASLASLQSSSTTISRLSSPQTEKHFSLPRNGYGSGYESIVDENEAKSSNSHSANGSNKFITSSSSFSNGRSANWHKHTTADNVESSDSTNQIVIRPNGNDAEEHLRPSSPDSRSFDTVSNSGSDWEGLERICGEAAARGTQESEVELKFMLDLMYQAGCIDWTLLLCLLRRDFTFLTKHVTIEFIVNKCGEVNVDRLKLATEQLAQWAESSCFGYRTLIYAFEKHLQLLSLQLISSPPTTTTKSLLIACDNNKNQDSLKSIQTSNQSHKHVNANVESRNPTSDRMTSANQLDFVHDTSNNPHIPLMNGSVMDDQTDSGLGSSTVTSEIAIPVSLSKSARTGRNIVKSEAERNLVKRSFNPPIPNSNSNINSINEYSDLSLNLNKPSDTYMNMNRVHHDHPLQNEIDIENDQCLIM